MDFSSDKLRKVKEGFIGQKMIVLPPDIRRLVNENPITKDLHLTAIGFYPHAVYHDRMRKNGSQEFILLYCIDGQGDVMVEEKKYELSPNTFIILPPHRSHHYRSSVNDPWSINWVHFVGKKANSLFSRYTNNAALEVKSIPYDEERLKLFNQIISLQENSYSGRNMEVTNIYLLHFLSSLIYYSEINHSSYSVDVITKSIDFMKENIGNSLSMEDLATNHNLSVSRYSELFKQKTGYPPIHYFIQLKIHKSCQYLYFTDMSIKEVCLKVGFEDPFYFSRMFKKIMGVSPSKYKSGYKK